MSTIEQAIAKACKIQRHADRATVTTPDGREHCRQDPAKDQQVAIVIYLGNHGCYATHWSIDHEEAKREAQNYRRRGNAVVLLPLDVTEGRTGTEL